jgi:hypothetical protein
MRMFGALSAAAVVATYFGAALAYGQQVEQRPPAEEQFEPYHTHHDARQGHDHDYPDRGSIVREAPQGATVVSYAGLSYRFRDGVWYEPRGPAFMVVEPPIGLVVPTLPTFSTVLAHGGDLYLYCNNVYYQPRPDLGGYEVVNDPAETPPKARVASAAAAAAPAVASGATISAAAPTAARVAAAPGPEIESDVPTTPATVVPYTVPSATAVPASSVRVAAAKMTPDPAPVAPTSAAILGNTATVAATPASAVYIATPAAAATMGSGAAPAAPVAMVPTAAPVAAPTVAAATPNIAPAAAVATVPVVAAPAVAAVPMPSAAAPNLPAAAAIPAVATAPVTLPASYSSSSPPPPPKGVRAEVLPRNGQSQEQLAKDRYECYQFAVKQSGYDPIHSGGAALQQQQYDYDRAQAGCFDARGYSVR